MRNFLALLAFCCSSLLFGVDQPFSPADEDVPPLVPLKLATKPAPVNSVFSHTNNTFSDAELISLVNAALMLQDDPLQRWQIKQLVQAKRIIKPLEQESLDCSVSKSDLETGMNPQKLNTFFSVQISCEANLQFSVLVKLALQKKVLVLRQNAEKASTITLAMCEWQWQDVDSLVADYITSPEQWQGLMLKQALRSGQALRASNFEKALLVQRGQEVTLHMVGAGISIAGKGTALNPGAAGDSIDVEYKKTKRVLKAKVLGAGQVEVLF